MCSKNGMEFWALKYNVKFCAFDVVEFVGLHRCNQDTPKEIKLCA
jgi:hypothetical protein